MNQAVWKFLQERDDLKLVILAARWPLSIEGGRYGREAGTPVRLEWSGDPTVSLNDHDNASLVEAGLLLTVQELLNMGRQVVILGQIPEIGWDVPSILVRSEMFDLPKPAPLTDAEFKARAGRSEDLLSGIAAQQDAVRYVQLSDLFCINGACAFENEDGLPLYVDDDHISRTTAEQLLPERLSQIWSAD